MRSRGEAKAAGSIAAGPTGAALLTPVLQRAVKYGKKADFEAAKVRVESHIGSPNSQPGLWDGATKPSWIDRDKLFKYLAGTQGITEYGEGKNAFYTVACARCPEPVTAQGCGIDHAYGTGWKSYLEAFQGTLTKGEAQVLYNDPEWLRLVHANCNSKKEEKKTNVTRLQSSEVNSFL